MSISEQGNENLSVDVLIIGAGPAGLAAAIALAQSDISVALVDMQSESQLRDPAFDGREIAINHMSRCIMQELGIWKYLDPQEIHPLQEAKVENGSSSRFLHFQRQDHSGKPLGYLIANHRIRKASYQALQGMNNIRLLDGHKLQGIQTFADSGSAQLVKLDQPEQLISLNSKLIIAADSRFSKARSMMGISAKMKEFGKSMMVFNAQHQYDHDHTAQEIFNYGGTCAILPLANKTSSIVITNNSHKIAQLENLSDEQLCYQAEEMLAGRLGKLDKISQAVSYPLVGVYSDRFIGQRFALIGDAAVGMHPVTAHGYNLGLRSVDGLCKHIRHAKGKGSDIGSQWLLHKYEAQHKLLSKPIYEATNLVVGLFTNDQPAAKAVRELALRLSDKFQPFKSLVTRRLIQER